VLMATSTAILSSTAQSPCPVFHHILVATDFSESSHRALRQAMLLGAPSNTRLSLVHVLRSEMEYTPFEEAAGIDFERNSARQKLEHFVMEAASSKQVETILLRRHSVADAISSFAREHQVDLLVVGTRGRGALGMLALGSVAEQLLRMANCPVVTVGPHAEIFSEDGALHSILFATDFGPGSMKAAPIALALAEAHQAKLILLHMLAPIPASSASLSAFAPAPVVANEVRNWERSAHERVLSQLKKCVPYPNKLATEPEFLVGTNLFAEGVLTAVSKFDIGLIVMGANRTTSPRLASHIPWTAIHEVVREASRPVMTVIG
jgi:nucleotide-binding universal stress UspA family protein